MHSRDGNRKRWNQLKIGIAGSAFKISFRELNGISHMIHHASQCFESFDCAMTELREVRAGQDKMPL